jgi:phosphopantetheine adenylyltransferase/dephospho-CoA kinase
MRSIGLTGGIASGKSTVTAALADLGAAVVDADKLGHRAYEPGAAAYNQVVAAFGDEIVAADGTINRAALGAKVFGAPAEMTKLTDIVWPAIAGLVVAELDAARAAGAPVAVVEAAVLFEAGWDHLFDEVWVISAPPDVARRRLMDRNGFSAEEAGKRIASQLGNAEREAGAGVVIRTDCSLDEVRGRVDAAWDALQDRIAAPG